MPTKSSTRSSITMIMLWIILLFVHQGYTLVPVKTVQLGEPANLTCALPKVLSSRGVHWYKQRVGDTLKLIVTLYESSSPEFGQEILKSRFQTQYDKKFSNLTILKTIQEDEGIYHCGVIEWINPEWSGTYLLVKGNNQVTSNYTVVQQPAVSNPLRPGDSATLQCSVHSDSDSVCPSDHNVFWFRTGSDQLHPSIIYTAGNSHNQCEKISESQERCVYRFSKNVSSSDAGTYYCAVATCGEILFGNGTKLDMKERNVCSLCASVIIFLACTFLSTSLSLTAVLMKRLTGEKREQNNATSMFSAVVFTVMIAGRGETMDAKKVERQQIYRTVKAFGLD